MTASSTRGRYSQRKNRWKFPMFPSLLKLLLSAYVCYLLPLILCEPDWRPRPFATSLERQSHSPPYDLYNSKLTPEQGGHSTSVQENMWNEHNKSRPYKPQSPYTQYKQMVRGTSLDSQRSYRPHPFVNYEKRGHQTSVKELGSPHAYKSKPFKVYRQTGHESLNEDIPRPHKSQITIEHYYQKDLKPSLKELDTLRPYKPRSQVERHKGRDSLENNLKVEELDSELLVGFAHDPYEYSLKSKDFENSQSQPTTEASTSKPRDKRGVLHLYNMISCASGCDPIKYKGYGCYCGFLGEGRPLDGVDHCCAMHDKCYENLFCPFYTVYFQPYYWTCYRGKPLCALENYSTRNKFVNGCAADLCECDRRLAMCLRKYTCPRRPAICTSSPLRLLQNLIMLT